MTSKTTRSSYLSCSTSQRSYGTSKHTFTTCSNLSFLGKTRAGFPVNEVELPAWAKNEHDFVRVHREFLESRPVGQTIRFWLDLLFGDKQRNPTYSNVFYAYAYEYYVRLKQNEMEDHNIDTINEFMQMPMALFTEPIFKIDKKKEALML